MRTLYKSEAMEKTKYYILLWLTGLFFIVSSCDKTQIAGKRFIKEGRWCVTELTAGTTSFTKLPKWSISACENQEEYCTAIWEHQGGSTTTFFWKFYNIGGNFSLFVDPGETDTGTMAYSQCRNFSGEYKVIENNRNGFQFESEESVGYPGKLVKIVLTAQ